MDIIKSLFDKYYEKDRWVDSTMLYNRVRDLILEAYYRDIISDTEFDIMSKRLSEIR